MLTCQSLSDDAAAYMDASLPAPRRLRIKAHLLFCPACRRYLQQLKIAMGLARHAATEPPPPEVEERLVSMFRQARRQDPPG
ncbi:MAG: zf-HC2 domain-containing protein [Alphaproteobacteria bacterium]